VFSVFSSQFQFPFEINKGVYSVTVCDFLQIIENTSEVCIYFSYVQLRKLTTLFKLDNQDQMHSRISIFDLRRLSRPHAAHGATLDAYSQFVSAFRVPSLYERKLVETSEMKMTAVKVNDRLNKFIEGVSLKLNDGDENGDENIDWSAWIFFERKKWTLS
jgi:hypothetical protein